MSARAIAIWRLGTGLETPLPRWLTHMGGKLMLAFDRVPLNPLLCGILHRAAWGSSWHGSSLLPERMIEERVKQNPCDLVLEILHHHLCSIILRSALFIIGKDFTRVWKPRGVDDWGPSWMLATAHTHSCYRCHHRSWIVYYLFVPLTLDMYFLCCLVSIIFCWITP